jgi:hypothetical protein
MNKQSYTREDIEKILGEPNKVVGYRSDGRPIYNIAGGSVEFEGTDDVEDRTDDDDDDDDDNSEEEDDWTPPTKEEWQKILDAKKKADSESAQRKRLLREKGINPKDGSPLKTTPKLSSVANDDDDDDSATEKTPAKRTVEDSFDAKALEKRLQREMERNLLDQEKEVRNEERSRSRTLMSAIPEALNTEGWNGKAMPRILKLLDLDSLEVDEDGVAGLDEQVQELKRDFPEFFKRTRMKEAAEKVADRKTAGGGAKKSSPAKTEGTWAENIARALHGEG